MNHPKLRWYDKDEKLASLIEALKFINEKKVEIIMMHIKKLIDAEEPDLIDNNLDEYQLRRRWYDKNPYTWLIINALKYASPKLTKEVVNCLIKDVEKYKEFTGESLSVLD